MIERKEDGPKRSWACVVLGEIVMVVEVFAGDAGR